MTGEPDCQYTWLAFLFTVMLLQDPKLTEGFRWNKNRRHCTAVILPALSAQNVSHIVGRFCLGMRARISSTDVPVWTVPDSLIHFGHP